MLKRRIKRLDLKHQQVPACEPKSAADQVVYRPDLINCHMPNSSGSLVGLGAGRGRAALNLNTNSQVAKRRLRPPTSWHTGGTGRSSTQGRIRERRWDKREDRKFHCWSLSPGSLLRCHRKPWTCPPLKVFWKNLSLALTLFPTKLSELSVYLFDSRFQVNTSFILLDWVLPKSTESLS